MEQGQTTEKEPEQVQGQNQTAQQNDYFKPVLFIEDGPSTDVLPTTRFMYNDGTRLVQLTSPQGTLVPVAPDNPMQDIGAHYSIVRQYQKAIHTNFGGKPYEITEFEFGVKDVPYQPLLATKENAQAFGMTLFRPGECVPFHYDNLVMNEYRYGEWAGYQSPYLGPGRGRDLLTINATDLEFHNFPHIFLSHDSLPLVISVARWRPYVGKIALADLWVMPGHAVLLPPKVMPPPPADNATPEEKWKIIIDMHGNRNSALACRFDEYQTSLSTTTVLGNWATMEAPATCPHYHEEKSPTVHDKLPLMHEQGG